MNADLINGLFELLAGAFVLNHCRALYRDKQIKGVSILSSAFFTLWGLWNLHFYPHLGQVWSFYGGIAVVVANAVWVAMMVYYTSFYDSYVGEEQEMHVRHVHADISINPVVAKSNIASFVRASTYRKRSDRHSL
jgi:ABC-type transport system involved in cytochrome c biogenesis permease subunit